MRKQEYPHNEPEQVRRYLVAALELVEDLEPAEDLRVPVFTKAVELLAAKQLFFEQPTFGLPNMALPGGHR